jgi:hypothetical protein
MKQALKGQRLWDMVGLLTVRPQDVLQNLRGDFSIQTSLVVAKSPQDSSNFEE